MTEDYWTALEELTSNAHMTIDRPKGSRHPRYPAVIYPLDYGYLEGTTAPDGAGIDVWRGSSRGARIVAVVCTVDLVKKDAEIKILIDCTTEEIAIVDVFYNEGPYMKGLTIKR